MKHGSLFSGIGGFDLAAEWMGWENVFNCEKDEWCRMVLKKNFPSAKQYDDIKTFDATNYHGQIDIISGGFPCQPFSNAGKRKGTQDPRYLFPDMLRIIKECNPKYVVSENVYGIAKTALQGIVSSMDNLGYFSCCFNIPASAVGALHRRSRIWIVSFKKNSFNPNPNSLGSHREEIFKQGEIKLPDEQDGEFGSLVSQSIREGSDTRIFRDANGIPDRVDRIKAIGNAIVPQVAYEIFNVIEQSA